MEDKKALLEDKKALLENKKALLEIECVVLLKEHTAMKEILINRKAAGNKTDHETACTNRSEIEEEVQVQDAAAAAAGNGGSQASPSKLFDAIHNHIEDYPIPASLDEIFRKLGIGQKDARKADLELFYGYCDSLFYQSEESTADTYMSQEYAKDIQVTVNAIVGWTRGKKILRNSRFCRPSSQAQETRGVHPILLALMWKINSILKGTAHFTSEQYLPKQLEKSKRWMDALWSKAPQHFLSSANGNLIGKSCEFKPISRSGEAYKKMVKDGINQELGHNLQVLWDSCYQFCGGLGKDGETSGIVLTMISASLLGSKLSGVGTQNVDLRIRVSDDKPLFSAATTKILADEVNFASLGLRFDPRLPNQPKPMQPGFLALVDYISNEGTPPQDTDQDTDQDTVIDLSLASDDSSISAETVEYLGSGAFSSVYDCKLSGDTGDGETRAVLKMSKNWDSTELDRELKALQALTHEAIPKLFKNDLVTVTVKARCERKYVKGLLLNLAIGKSLQQKPENVPVQQVLTAVENVLDYAHEKGWHHLDVQPSNIIVVDNGDETCRYILIDWGTAVKKVNETTKLTSFHGTPPFSHPEMLLVKKKKDDRWSGPVPSAALDKFSLAMTLAYIEHKGVPWSGFHKKVVTDDMLEDRYEKAVQLINNSLLDQPSKDKVLGWIPEPEKQSPSSQPQTPQTRRVRGTKKGPAKQGQGRKRGPAKQGGRPKKK